MKAVGSRSPGFTLLEVLVALAILAISSIAVIRQTGQSLGQLQQLQQKTVALVIAENRLNAMRISEQWPGTGRQNQSVTFAGQQWQVDTEVSATSEPWLRKIEISVSIDNSRGQTPLVSLTGYRGRY